MRELRTAIDGDRRGVVVVVDRKISFAREPRPGYWRRRLHVLPGTRFIRMLAKRPVADR